MCIRDRSKTLAIDLEKINEDYVQHLALKADSESAGEKFDESSALYGAAEQMLRRLKDLPELHIKPASDYPGFSRNSMESLHQHENTPKAKAGIVMHSLLEQIGRRRSSIDDLPTQNSVELESIQQLLLQEGLEEQEALKQAQLVSSAVKNILTDPRGRWILQRHREDASELRLQTVRDGHVRTLIIDRAFIDEDKVQWVVDYKLVQQDLELASDLQKVVDLYKSQLEAYAEALSLKAKRRTKLGLSLPLQRAWYEWDYC